MASVLKWKAVKVAGGSPVQMTVTGNADTRVVTRYFWLPVSDADAGSTWDRNDGVSLQFDPSQIKAGQQNHLGFACRAASVDPSDKSLYITFEIRQGDSILLRQGYASDVSDPNTPVELNDGITLQQ